MAQRFDASKFNRQIRDAQRKAEAEWRREVDRVNRENRRRVDAHNRKVEQHNRKAVADHNRRVEQHNRKVTADYNRQVDRANAHNRAALAELDRRLRTASSGPRYTIEEQALADRVQYAIAQRDDREWDTFLSYARIDGATVGDALRRNLGGLTSLSGLTRSRSPPARAKRSRWTRAFRRLGLASYCLRRRISSGASGRSANSERCSTRKL